MAGKTKTIWWSGEKVACNGTQHNSDKSVRLDFSTIHYLKRTGIYCLIVAIYYFVRGGLRHSFAIDCQPNMRRLCRINSFHDVNGP